jgi:uncharacterized protein with GYD domain
MSTYIVLANYTQQGMQNIKESPARLEAAKELHKKFGAELKAFYLTMGAYDAIAITEAPDDQTAAKVALSLGSKGAIRTATLRAFTENEYRDIIAALA